MTSFWVRKSRLAEGMDRSVLDALLTWFEQEWSFDHPVIVANEQFEQQVARSRQQICNADSRSNCPTTPAGIWPTPSIRQNYWRRR